jgi:galactonate dehydratase
MDAGTLDCLATLQAIRAGCGDAFELYVDALWRLDVPRAAEFSYALRELKVGFLEAPLPPESVEEHRQLATKSVVPIAIGESYRTRYEIGPFLEAGACQVLQPDIGRCGITEGLRIAKLAESYGVPVIPHLSIGLGPQVAAAIHLSAAIPGIRMLECNPKVYSEANRFLKSALTFDAATAEVPTGNGLGIALDETVLTESIR